MSLHPTIVVPGLELCGSVHGNLSSPVLVESALYRKEGQLSDRGAFVALTGKYTGRCPKDRFLVVASEEHSLIDWGSVNQAMSVEVADRLRERLVAHLRQQELYIVDAGACADFRYRLPIRVVTDQAWHALFARCLFRNPMTAEMGIAFDPSTGLTILASATFRADPKRDGTRSDVFIILDFPRKLVMIGGTGYAGEIKKAVFSYLNYLLPSLHVLPMHCSANIGRDDRCALFFGLSGTGKTTLSANPQRRLIGDDEHGWTDQGIFNIEGGCYAKCINLSQETEPQIYDALHFGSVLENVVLDPVTHQPDFVDGSITENTRAAYPLDHITGAEPTGCGGHPDTILFLTCDAFGVLPPLSRLNNEQAMYHFLSGYTARVAGTEAGITSPEATFSTCFGAPFLPLFPARYAELLGDRLRRHHSQVWLVNTGWSGGPAGAGGQRIRLSYTRAMVQAILGRELENVEYRVDPVFGLSVPVECPDVPGRVLNPRTNWDDEAKYDVYATRLAKLFQDNFRKYESQVAPEIRHAGPTLS